MLLDRNQVESVVELEVFFFSVSDSVSFLSDKDPCGWPRRRFLFLFLLSISGSPIFVNIKKIQKKSKNGPCHRKTGL